MVQANSRLLSVRLLSFIPVAIWRNSFFKMQSSRFMVLRRAMYTNTRPVAMFFQSIAMLACSRCSKRFCFCFRNFSTLSTVVPPAFKRRVLSRIQSDTCPVLQNARNICTNERQASRLCTRLCKKSFWHVSADRTNFGPPSLLHRVFHPFGLSCSAARNARRKSCKGWGFRQ